MSKSEFDEDFIKTAKEHSNLVALNAGLKSQVRELNKQIRKNEEKMSLLYSRMREGGDGNHLQPVTTGSFLPVKPAKIRQSSTCRIPVSDRKK